MDYYSNSRMYVSCRLEVKPIIALVVLLGALFLLLSFLYDGILF